MNDAFGTMQKAGAAMTGTGTAIVGACMGTVTATFDTQDALAEVASLGVEDLGTLEKAAKNFSDTWREPRSRISYPRLMISSPVLRL